MTDDVPAANGDAAAIEAPPAEVPEATADVPPAPEPEPAPAEPAPPPVKTEAPLPVRQYLEATVVPVLMQAMQQLVKDRPEDPIGFVADYLISHNPKKQKVDHNTDNNATS
jgi:protein dpy-30